MRFFLLLAAVLHVTGRIILFDEHTSEASVPTFDFFEYRSDPYNVTGLACRLPLISDPETKICKVTEPPLFAQSDFTGQFRQTVLYVKFDDAMKCGISTISQLFERAEQMQPLLSGAGYPSSKTLVIFMNTTYKGTEGTASIAGCPAYEPYMSPGFSILDSPPPKNMAVALVGKVFTMQLDRALNKTRPFALNVVQETDKWNSVFLSAGYIFFNWSVIVAYFVSIVAAAGLSLIACEKGTIALDMRNAIFWMALFAAILYLVVLPMRYQTYLRRNIETVGNMFFSTAFHLLLYLWSVLFKQLQPSSSIYILRGVIVVGALSSIAGCVFNFLLYNLPKGTPSVVAFGNWLSYTSMPIQIVVALFWMFFGVKFFVQRHSLSSAPQAVTALVRLSVLGLLGFLGYALAAISNLSYFRINTCQPSVFASVLVIRSLSALLRVATLLFVLGIKAYRPQSPVALPLMSEELTLTQ